MRGDLAIRQSHGITFGPWVDLDYPGHNRVCGVGY